MKVSRLAALALICCLVSCNKSSSIEDNLRDYINTISAYTDESWSVESINRKALEYPRPRHLVHKKQEERISFREFFQLSSCELNRLVGEHNSALNRNQGHSEVLFYNLAFITLADQCLSQINEQNLSIANTLTRVKKEKEDDVNRLLWNATFASKEFRHFFSPYRKPIHDEDLATLHKTVSNITFFTHVERSLSSTSGINKNIKDQRSTFDKALGRVSRMRGGGKVLISVLVSTVYLQEANRALKTLLTSTCNISHRAFVNTTHNIFEQRLVEKLTTIREQAQEISLLDSMVRRLTPKEINFYNDYWVKHWQTNETSTVGQFSRAFDEHISLWTQLRNNCQKN